MKLILVSILVILLNYVHGYNYILKKNGKACILANTDVKISMKNIEYHLQPLNKSVTGNCNPPNGTNSSIALPLIGKKKINKHIVVGFLIFNFTMDSKTKNVSFALSIKLKNKTSIKLTDRVEMGTSSQYFSCHNGVHFHDGNNKLRVVVYNSKIQAFNVTKNKFNTKKFACSGDVVTTVKPKTTTVKPSPTVKPAFIPTFYVKEKKKVCALAQFNAAFNFEYMDDKKNKRSKQVYVNPFSDAPKQVTGRCGNLTTMMNITFNKSWFLILNFTLNKYKYKLAYVALHYNADNKTFPNISKAGAGIANGSFNLFGASKDGYYYCPSVNPLTLKSKQFSSVKLTMKDVKLEMFRKVNSSLTFDGKAEKCTAAGSSSGSPVVPIIVGVVLGLLVLIVLIVYLVGRRRRLQAAGYQSI